MRKITYILGMGLMMGMGSLNAQFDDLYYEPSDDVLFYEEETSSYYDDDEYDYYYEDGDESAYYGDGDYWSDYDYYYTSRLRRFHRPFVRVGFYNSWVCNSLFYDPFDFYSPWGGSYFSFGFGTPGFAMAYHSNPYLWNSWRSNRWWSGYNSWGWGGYNNWGWGGYNGWGWNSFNPYCPPGFVGGGGYYGPGYIGNVAVVNTYNQVSNPKGVYYGSRRAGSTSSSVKGVRTNPRTQNPRTEQLNPGVLGEDNARSITDAEAQVPDRRTPRRTSARQDELAVSRLDDAPGRRSVTEGSTRRESAVKARRPSVRSVSPSTQTRRSESSDYRPSSRRSDYRSSDTSPRRSYNRSESRTRPSRRSYNNSSPRRNYNRSSSPTRSSSRSASPSRSSSSPRSSSRSSSSGSRSSSPRRNG